MDAIISYYKSLGLDFWILLEASAIILAGLLIFGLLGKFIFGKKSNMICTFLPAFNAFVAYRLNWKTGIPDTP